jgi:5'-deoxynucleotidase YfbR-like HD superfamily hydrolase
MDAEHTIQMVRSGNKVRRFHTVDLLVPETVGHHSANVALICAYLVEFPSLNLIMAALHHDLTEQWTGDVPATAKWESQKLKDTLTEIENKYDFCRWKLTEGDYAILKWADMLDLCYKCVDEMKLGNSTVSPILNRGLAFLRASSPSEKVMYLVEGIERSIERILYGR